MNFGGQFIRKFTSGFLSPLVGASLLVTNRTLRRLAFLPFVATVFVFVFGLSLGLPLITSAVTPFTQRLLAFFGVRLSSSNGVVLSTIIPFLIWPALALALFYILMTLTRLIASPFYGLLAERVLMKQGLLKDEKIKAGDWLQKQIRITRAAVIKAGLFLIIGLVLGLLSFIPGVGLFTAFAFLILLAYDVVDYALEALAWSYEMRVAYFREHFAVFLGLGVSLGLVLLIPGLNFFVLPASVAGASDLVRRTLVPGD
jgi:uncharacterized protein involved in cysteine biosynthesis